MLYKNLKTPHKALLRGVLHSMVEGCWTRRSACGLASDAGGLGGGASLLGVPVHAGSGRRVSQGQETFFQLGELALTHGITPGCAVIEGIPEQQRKHEYHALSATLETSKSTNFQDTIFQVACQTRRSRETALKNGWLYSLSIVFRTNQQAWWCRRVLGRDVGKVRETYSCSRSCRG